MYRAPDVFPAHGGDSLDDLILLDANGEPEVFDVGESGAQVELAARDDDEVPYDLRVAHDGTPLHTAAVAAEFFGPGVARERFATVAGRRLAGVTDDVDEATATAAIGNVLEDIRDRVVADAVHTVDERARKLLKKTAAVTYSPNGNGDLVVAFDDADFSGSKFAYYRTRMTIPPSQWANTAAAPSTPRVGVRRVFAGAEGRSRWRTVRRVWMAMAEIGGDAPPAEIPVTGDDLRERGKVPKIDVGLGKVRDAVRSNRKFDDVREELGVSSGNKKVLQGALEKLDLDSDVKHGWMKP